MNLLELTQEVAFRSRTVPGQGQPASVNGLTGRQARCLQWVQQAWREIQTHRPNWGWMRRDFTGNLYDGTRLYGSGDFSITRFRSWLYDARAGADSGWTFYRTSEGVAGERPITFVPWPIFRTAYGRGEPQVDMPQVFTVDPRQQVVVNPTPDADYTLKGEYMLSPQELVAGTDVPELPETWHDLIVARALALLYESDEAAELEARARNRGFVLMAELEAAELPPMGFAGGFGGGALA